MTSHGVQLTPHRGVLVGGGSRRWCAFAAGEGDARAKDPERPEEVADLAAVLDERRREDDDDQGNTDRAPAENWSARGEREGPSREEEESARDPAGDEESRLTFASAVPI